MILQSLKIALESLWVNKMRSMLSMLGIVIGVGAVIAIVSVGTGSTQSVTSSISYLGSNMISISASSGKFKAGQASSSSQDKFSLELAEYMAEFCPSVKSVIPVKQVGGRLIVGDISVNATMIGTNVDYTEVNNYLVKQGRFISSQDEEKRSQVMVLGSDLSEDLFEEGNPIGQK